MEVKYKAHWSINLLRLLKIQTNKLSFREVNNLHLKTRVPNCLQLWWKYRDNSARINKWAMIAGRSSPRLNLIGPKASKAKIQGIRFALKAISTKEMKSITESNSKKRFKEQWLTRWCKRFLKIRKLILKIYRRHLLRMATFQGKRGLAQSILRQTIARVTA